MTIRIANARTLRAVAALPPAMSLRRIFWIVLAAHLVLVGAVWLLGGGGGSNGRQVSTLSGGEPADLNTIAPEAKAPAPRTQSATSAAKATARTRPTAAADRSLATPAAPKKAGKKAAAAAAAQETPPKKLITRAIPQPVPTRSGKR